MTSAAERVFIVDDNVISIMMVEEHLRERGFHVIKMSTASGLLAKLEYAKPDVLLIDPTLPKMDLEHTIKGIRASKELADLAVVLYCDLDPSEGYELAQRHQMDGYFCKSVALTKLPDFIDGLFEEEA